jgi:hypothetical protein
MNCYFDNKEIRNYYLTISKTISYVVKTYNKLQIEEHTTATIKEGELLIKDVNDLLKNIKTDIISLEKIIQECNDFIEDVKDELSQPEKEDQFIYMTKNGLLSYTGKEKYNRKDNKKKQNVIIKELNYKTNIPIVTNIKDIKPAFYYLNSNDKNHQSGIYININNDIFIKVPFPDVIDPKKDNEKKNTIKCKYFLQKDCEKNRKRLSKLFNSEIRCCNFAHSGDTLIKLGHTSRCPAIPDFGNPKTFNEDINNLNIRDIKTLLFYSLTDVLLSSLWFENKKEKNKIYDNIEIV